MTLGIKVELRNGFLDDVKTAIDAGTGAGKLKIYNGTRPATGGAVTTQTLLAEPLFGDPSAPAASGGVLTFNSFTDDDSAAATDTGTWARITDSDDTFVADADVGKQFTLNGNTTSGSAIVTGLPETGRIDTGMSVTGTGIPASTTVQSVDSGTQVTLTANATATGTGVALTFTTVDADLLLNDNDITAEGIVRVTSGTLTAGNP